MLFFTNDGHIFDDSVACEVCCHCLFFEDCINNSLSSVLPVSDCAAVLTPCGCGCAGNCKSCFLPENEKTGD